MAGSHSTPPLQTTPIQPHHGGGAAYLSPKMLATTIDLPPATMRRSPSPMSPSGMGSFVTKAKAILKGRRSSVQVTASDSFGSGKLAAHRTQSHYQTHSARPTPHRQATAPLPSTSKSLRRPALKRSDGSYSISNPISSNIEATYKYCELIDTADMAARVTRPSSPRESTGRSSSPSTRSDVDGPIGPNGSSRSAHQSASDSQHATRDATITKGSRPKSDVFPLSATESTIRSRSNPPKGIKNRVLAAFDGYQNHSRETLLDPHAPFDLHCATPFDNPTCSSIKHGLGLGISDTVMALRNAGMLYPEDTAHRLGDMFSDALDMGQETESNVLAWLGLDSCTCLARRTEDGDHGDRNGHSTEIVDEYLGFGEDALSFSMRAGRRPMGIARGLESVTAGGAELLLTDWRARLDASCNFALCLVNAQTRVNIIANDVSTPGQSVVGPIQPLHTTKSALPRSRSKTLPSAHAPPRPTVWIPPNLWDPVSAPTTPSFSNSPYCIASGSRTPSVKAEQGKRRRNTRDMFFESQVSHMLKVSRSTRRPLPCRLEIIEVDAEEENSPDWIVVAPGPSRFPRSPGRRNLRVSTSENSRPSAKEQHSGTGMSKSHSARSGLNKSGSRQHGISKSPSGSGIRIAKSPSVRSGLAKSKPGPSRRTKRSPSRVRGSSHSKARLPASSSTRSLPGNSKNGTANTPHSRARSNKSERRQGPEKENMPTQVQTNEDPTMLRVCVTPTPHCSRTEADALSMQGKVPVTEVVNGRRLPAPIVPPRSPARPRTYSRI
ncbi:enhancer of polycomb-like protein 1 [Ceratobasidium sp. AG-Ba]|nr:enhancer of polycomb-like protein 1 [Ceratobasidium sp. AG-Ba]